LISNSTISHNQTGISGIYGITNLINCIVSYNTYGIEYADSVDSCTINNNQYGVYATYIMNSTVDSNSVRGVFYGDNVTNCQIKYNGVGIYLEDSVFNITKNIIENNTIGIELGASNNIYCNKICNNTSYDLIYTMINNISVANNYWCTPDSASTTAVIYDGYDNINYGLVNFMPIDTLQCYLQTDIPINEFQNISFNIFPNPASDYLTVALPTNFSKTEIKIFNMLGELEYSSTTTRQNTHIDISNLTSGVHIIQIETIDNTSRLKFIKQ